MKRFKFCLMLALFAAFPANAFAEIMVTLSSPDDLLHLAPSQVVTIDVNVSGVELGDTLFLLSADVLLPTHVFGMPTLPMAGALVPSPTSTFFSTVTPGSPDQAISSLFDGLNGSTNAITDNGVFFSFQAPVVGTGSGAIRFDPSAPPQVFGEDAGFGLIDTVTAGGSLAVNAVPEPGSVAVLSLVSCVGLVGRRRSSSF